MTHKCALVVDDHPITHLGCRRLLKQAGFEEILEAVDDQSAYRTVDRTPPDLIILDVGLPGVGGLNMIRPLRSRLPDTPILVFSMSTSPAFAVRALEAGAQGYLSKNSAPDNFLIAIKNLLEGRQYLEKYVATEVAVLTTSGPEQLTPREMQVLSLLVKGKRYQEIADDIHVSYKTVANTTAEIRRKLSASSLPDLIRTAVDLGIA